MATELGIRMLHLLTTEHEAFYAGLGWRVNDSNGGKVVMSLPIGYDQWWAFSAAGFCRY
jgi:hypothetical protein